MSYDMQRSVHGMEGEKRKIGSVRKTVRSSEGWKEEDLSGIGLSSLPNHPSLNLSCITKLDLSCNNLEMISESTTARLVNMVELDLHSNQLKRLPHSIGCLSKLKRLDASGNLLNSLPKTIQNCRALEELFVSFNQLTQLPESMGPGLSNLRTLSVHSNKLTFLPSTTHRLSSLRLLDVHLNCLLTLPRDLHLLPYLHTIDVSQNFNHFHSLPDSIGLLPSIVHLNISYNRISVLPDSLACATALCSLRADGNPLVSPPLNVVENGVDAIRRYLIERMNAAVDKGRGGWLWRMARCGKNEGGVGWELSKERKSEEEDYYWMKHAKKNSYHYVEGYATPCRKYMGKLSSPLKVLSRQCSAPATTSTRWK